MSLHAKVKSTVDLNPAVADPGQMADLVFASLDPADYADAVRTMLRSYVREVMTEGRSLPVSRPPVPVRTPGPSPFVRALQEGIWKQRLGETFHTESGWKFLRECDGDDLTYIARERRELAEANLTVADRADALAGLLDEHGVRTVGELPDEALEPVLN